MPEDGQADPVGVTNVLAKAAKMEGVKIFEKTPVEKILIKDGKVVGVQTTENVQDSLGNNLENTFINWNDDTNSNWLEQFQVVLNSTLQGGTVIGKPNQSEVIDGATVEQYKINTQNTES